MRRFRVINTYTSTATVEVEAENEAEALEKALGMEDEPNEDLTLYDSKAREIKAAP